jgi:hypothetical protein
MRDFWSEPNHDTSADDPRCRQAILVEGESDRAALEVLARRRDRVLTDEGASIVPMGGATNFGHYLDRYGPAGLNLGLAGLCDATADAYFRAQLERAGLAHRAGRHPRLRLITAFVGRYNDHEGFVHLFDSDPSPRINPSRS